MNRGNIEAELRSRVVRTIEECDLLRDVRHVVLGLSGGPDSMCLLDVLRKLTSDGTKNDNYDFDIIPVHVNHGIRKGICDEEEEFCRAYCEGIGLVLRSFKFDCEEKAKEWGLSTEETGRKLRYDAFGEVCREIDIHSDDATGDYRSRTVVAIAQNADDQVETVLMRILRGTGIQGLAGIPYEREDERGYTVIRPLLDVAKSDILAYSEELGLNPRMDLTNDEPIYRRNKIRLELIPYLEENYNPNIRETLLRLSASAREDNDFVQSGSEKYLASNMERLLLNPTDIDVFHRNRDSKTKNSEAINNEKRNNEKRIVLNNDLLREMSAPIRRGIINTMLGEIGLKEDVGFEHYKALERLIQGDHPSASTDLPRGYRARREYERLIIEVPNSKDAPKGKFAKSKDVSSTEYLFDNRETDTDDNCKINADSGCGERDIKMYLLSKVDFDALKFGDSSGKSAKECDGEYVNKLVSAEYAAFDLDEIEKEYGIDASSQLGAINKSGEFKSGEFDFIAIRSRRPGDIMTIKIGPGKTGTKKVQDILIDSKIPLSVREDVRVAAIGNEVLWLITPAGYKNRWTAKYPITDATERVLLIEPIK